MSKDPKERFRQYVGKESGGDQPKGEGFITERQRLKKNAPAQKKNAPAQKKNAPTQKKKNSAVPSAAPPSGPRRSGRFKNKK